METKTKKINCLSYSLRLSGESQDEYISRIYNEFVKLMTEYSPFSYKNKPVEFASHQDENWIDGLFNHIITSDANKKGIRKIDRERLKCALWLPKILNNPDCFYCTEFRDSSSHNKKARLTIFCDKYDYVIPYKELNDKILVISGYPVDKTNAHKFR